MQKTLQASGKTLLFLIVALLACSCLEKDNSFTTRIGMALQPRESKWHVAATEYSVRRAASYKLPYFLANETTTDRLLQAIEKMVESECKALILAPDLLDEDSIQHLNNLSIPIVLYDRKININHAAYVGGNHQEAGAKAGTYINSALGTDANVLVLIPPGTNNRTRVDAFLSSLTGQYDTILVTSAFQGTAYAALYPYLPEDEEDPGDNEEIEDGAETGDNEAPDDGDDNGEDPDEPEEPEEPEETLDLEQFNAVYCPDDDLALGVLQIIDEGGLTNFRYIVGFGGSQEFLKEITERQLINLTTIYYSPQMIETCVEIAYNLVTSPGYAPPKETIIEMSWVDKSNVVDYINNQTKDY